MTKPDFIILDSGTTLRKRLGIDRTLQVSKISDVDAALQQTSKESLWILNNGPLTNAFVKSLVRSGLHQNKIPDFGDLLFYVPPARPSLVPPLHSYFRSVAGDVPSFKILPPEQLATVLTSEERSDLFIGGSIDQDSETITLIRGNLRPLVVPFTLFKPTGSSVPDFHRFELDDFGYAVRLGDYESSAHAILFEVDRDYRRRFNQQRVQSEKGFGPSLRRLRTLRRLSRSAFAGVSAKTIARLERGQTGKPQTATLNQIAKVLGVAPHEIETY